MDAKKVEQTNEHSVRAITIGSGGGITGEYQGVTLAETGALHTWSRKPGAQEETLRTWTTESDSARLFFDELDAMSFSTREFSEPGDLSMFIELDSAGSMHAVRWSGAATHVPPEFTRFYDRLSAFVQRRS